MKWKEHIMTNEDSLLKSLNRRQAAIKKIAFSASFLARKTLANGIFMTKLIYLMPVWAGCENNLIRALQTIQNRVARTVTRRNRFTPTKTLMKECGWLTVRQLMVFHSLVQLHKVVQSQKPEYLYFRVSVELNNLNERRNYNSKTRQSARGTLRHIPDLEAKLDLAKRSWCWRASRAYHDLPVSMKSESKLRTFKSRLKTWVKETVEN